MTPETLPSVTSGYPFTPLQASASYDDDFAIIRRSSMLSSASKKKGTLRFILLQASYTNNKFIETFSDYFGSLPDEVLLMMFKYLPKTALVSCACVCRRWKRIAYDNDLWPRIDLSLRKLVPGSMAHVLMRGPQILRMAQTEVRCF